MQRKGVPHARLFRLLRNAGAARSAGAGTQRRSGGLALAQVDGTPFRSLPAGRPLHAWPRSEMANQAHTRDAALGPFVAAGEPVRHCARRARLRQMENAQCNAMVKTSSICATIANNACARVATLRRPLTQVVSG